jgi:hypothetical protein
VIGSVAMVLARASAAATLVALLAAGIDAPSAQVAPRPDSTPAPHPRPSPPPFRKQPPPANICTTEWGWCQLPTLTAPLGVGCVCLTAQHQQVPGTTRYFPYEGTPSPYLQPHTSPPGTIR